MRIHTDKLTLSTLHSCLAAAIQHGDVAPDVNFVVEATYGSRKRERGIEVQLGTHVKTSGPTKSRHFKNTGTSGASRIYAASYDEWGHFLALVFLCDRNAIAGAYDGHGDFHKKTSDAYLTIIDKDQRAYDKAFAEGRYQGD